ncbi:MAG TPA: sugar ABC transporter substrate-binding protein [Solirubrobacteraceae bacterium]|nr:sugar ABC transporter substrate-binding protein [Solirubrobacteraceae bacterium]
MRRWAIVGLAVASMLALAGCGSSGSSSAATGGGSSSGSTGKAFKLGVSLTFNNTDFWSAYISYEQQFAKQYGAQLIGPLVNNNNPGQQITDIHTLINEGATALIVNPADSAAIAPALAYAQSKNIPVVSVDVAPSHGHVSMIVRANNQLYGQEACKYIASKAKSGTAAVLEGDLTSLNGSDRSSAFINCMKQTDPGVKVVAYATKWDTPTATTDAQDALHTYADLKAIYVEWSGPVPGILKAEASTGRSAPVGSPNHVILVSDDGVPFEMKDIQQGTFDATVSQPADLYAKYSILYAKELMHGQSFSAGQATDHQTTLTTVSGNLEDPINAPLVTKSNASDPNLWGNVYARTHPGAG